MQKSRNSSFISIVFFVTSTVYIDPSIAEDKLIRWVPAGASHIWRSNEKGWCNQGLHLQINSYSKDFFSKNQTPDITYNKNELLTKFQTIVDKDCHQATIARVSGFIDGRYVFEGCMNVAENWKLREVFHSDNIDKVINPKYFLIRKDRQPKYIPLKISPTKSDQNH